MKIFYKIAKISLVLICMLSLFYKIYHCIKTGNVGGTVQGNVVLIFLMAILAKVKHKSTDSSEESVDPELIKEFEEYELERIKELEKKSSNQ